MVILLLVLVPAALGALAFAIRDVRVGLGLLVGAAIAHSGTTAWLWTGRAATVPLLGLDPAGLFFLSITSVVFLVVSLYSASYLLAEAATAQGAGVRRFVPCLLGFLSAMTLVTVAQNLALLWAAVEATTLASAPLVYFHRRREALEATWKYLLICSVGIALALLGTFFLGVAAAAMPGERPGLSLPALLAAAPNLSRPWVEGAFVLALVGYGTKVGLVPLHTWLPDAHSQAPSPVSALLSGALLNCAFLGILRFFQVATASGNAAFARMLLVGFGLGSLAVGGALLFRQRDYKRLLAYSSIENMGIVAIGVGLGGAAVFGAMLHVLNHSLAKTAVFLAAGNVLREFGTTSATEVRGVLRRLPASGALLTALLFALGGTPPFGTFMSEFSIFRAAIMGTQPWLGAAFVMLLAIAFLGMAGVLLPMLQGEAAPAAAVRRERGIDVAAPFALTVGVLALGLHLPACVSDRLWEIARLLGG